MASAASTSTTTTKIENSNGASDKGSKNTPVKPRYFDLEIKICICDIEKETKAFKKTAKEIMQQFLTKLEEEVATITAPRFDLKASNTAQVTELLEWFAEKTGGTLMRIFSGSDPGPCIVFVVRYETREDLQNLSKMYKAKDQKLKVILKKLVFENKVNMNKRFAEKIDEKVDVIIEDKNYKKGLKFFPKDTGKQATATHDEAKTEAATATIPDRPQECLSLVQYLTKTREAYNDIDKEMTQIKEEIQQIQQKYEQLEQLSKDRENLRSIRRRNLESVAAKITVENPSDQEQDEQKKATKRKAQSTGTKESEPKEKQKKSEKSDKEKTQQQITETLVEANRRKEIGNNLLKGGKRGLAINSYEQAEELLNQIQPLSTKDTKEKQDILEKIYLNIAKCQLLLEVPDQALHYSSKALQINPRNAKALLRQGRAYHQLNQLDEAEEALGNALIQCAPTDTDVIMTELREVQKKNS